MRVKARKVGNSLTVTIPKDIAEEMFLSENVELDIFAREGAVVMQPVKSRWELTIERIRAEMPPPGDLTEDDIVEMCRDARKKIFEEERRRREAGEDLGGWR